MKKRILSLAVILALCVSVFGTFNVFADTYTQRVALKSYQPAVRTLIHDDDFNDIPVTGTYGSIKNSDRVYSSDYNAIWVADADGYEVESGNNALAFSAAWKHIQFNRTSNSDKLVVSFDMFDTATSSFGFRLINKGYTSNSAYAVLLNPWSSGGVLTTNGETVASSLGISSLGNKWVNVTLIFERVLNSAGTGYEASLKQFYLDGKLYDNLDATPTSNIDWWTRTSTVNFSIQTLSATVKIDNLLVYEPKADTMVATNVNVPSYVPAVKNIILDDNFETSTISGSTLSNTYANSFATTYNVGSLTEETGGNSYPVTNAWAIFKSRGTSPLTNANRLVLTFKIKAPDTLTANASYVAGFNTGSLSNYSAFKIYFSPLAESSGVEDYTNKYKVQLVTVGYDSSSNSYGEKYLQKSAVYTAKTDFTKFTVVLDKKLNSDGKTYGAYVSELYVNDENIGVWPAQAAYPIRTNWFETISTDETRYTFYMGNSSMAGWSLDDFLIYEPVGFNVSDMVVANDGTSADITFTDNIADATNAAVTATLADGSVINSTLSPSGKKLTATFDNALDITRNVYTINVTSGVKSTRNDVSPSYSKILGSGFEAVDLSDAALKIRNGSNTVLTGKLIIAAYDSSDNLVSAVINAADISAPVDLSTNMTYTLPSGDNISYYKFFGWNDAETLTPLFTNVTID